MQGEKVEVVTRVEIGKDSFHNPVYREEKHVVANVLVAPLSTSDLTGGQRLEGDKTRVELHFPKTFTANLRGAVVVVRGVKYRIEGDPVSYMLSNTPTSWCLKAVGVRVDG